MNKIFIEKYRMVRMSDYFPDINLSNNEYSSSNLKTIKIKLQKQFVISCLSMNIKNKYEYNDYVFNIHCFTNNSNNIRIWLEEKYHYSFPSFNQPNENTYRVYPQLPILVNNLLEEDNIKYLYHIVPNFKLKQIEKYGLAPRGKDSVFNDRKDRIYLVSTDKKGLNKLLQQMHQEYKNEEFTIFKIPYDIKYRYYIYDLATYSTQNMIAVFVLQNIPYNELEIIKL